MRRPDPTDVRASFSDAPIRRIYAECYTLGLTFIFHERNNHLRKALTMLVAVVWAVLEVANALDAIGVTLPPLFEFFRLFVMILIGRMWNIEINSFAELIDSGDGSEGGDD